MTGSELYKKLGDWFHNNASPLIPQPGQDYLEALVDEFQVFWNVREVILLAGFSLEGIPERNVTFQPRCHVINLPFIVGLHSGFSQAKLIELARHHPLDVQELMKTLDTMISTGYVMQDVFEADIPMTKAYIDATMAIAHVYPDVFSIHLSYMDERSTANAASILSNNPEHWPVTRLAKLMAGYDQNTLRTGEFFDDQYFNINNVLTTDDFIPKDATGLPRFELFLQRSGMLLSEVARKKLGEVGLWEQMLAVAKFDQGAGWDEDQGMAKLFSFCINEASEQLRPAIFRALSTMAYVTAQGVDDGIGMYKFLRKNVTDTWLEPLLRSPLLLINLVADEQFISFDSDIPDPNLSPKQHYYDIAVLDNPETLFDRCLKEIMATPADQLGASHFRVFLLDELRPPVQELSPDLVPEQVIKHMLEGLESFCIHESLEALRQEETNDVPFQGCNYVIKRLESRYELDYKAFEGLGSRSIRTLVEAGLDKRRLPRMNSRDKGHVISEELGL
jgi:hypothetical protein